MDTLSRDAAGQELLAAWIAKLEARLAYSFRNPANQRRRVRMACTRGTRRSQNSPTRQSRMVTNRKHDPGYRNFEEPNFVIAEHKTSRMNGGADPVSGGAPGCRLAPTG
jgi:hypothetical protein